MKRPRDMGRAFAAFVATVLTVSACGAVLPDVTSTVEPVLTVTSPPPDTAPTGNGPSSTFEARCGAARLLGGLSPRLPDEAMTAEATAAFEQSRIEMAAEPLFHDGYAWTLAHETPTELVLFGRAREQLDPSEARYADMSFERDDNGDWRLAGVGQCRLEIEAPGFGNATWILDEEPTEANTNLAVRIVERECANGEPPVGRAILPVVIPDDDRITIVVFVKPIQGDANCPGNPWHPLTIDLGEELGDRLLYDGWQVPSMLRTWPPTPTSIDSQGRER